MRHPKFLKTAEQRAAVRIRRKARAARALEKHNARKAEVAAKIAEITAAEQGGN
jgi:hypothetical protein